MIMEKHDERKVAAPSLPRSGHVITGQLLLAYTLLFALFFAVVFSPFWFYGKAFLWSSDGTSHHMTELLYLKRWFGAIVQNLRDGKWEIPFWDLSVGLGQNTVGCIAGIQLCLLFY